MRTDRGWSPTDRDFEWIESLGRPIHPVLAEIEAASVLEGGGRVPILDRDAGRVLQALVADRRRIVEVGTAIGYSTLWMALGQPSDGTIVTIDPDVARTSAAQAAWRKAGVAESRITVVNAPALDAFAEGRGELAGPFDFAFIDALKEEYSGYLDALLPRLVDGALLTADNVLWSGRVSGARPSRPGDGSDDLRAFCERVLGDPRFSGSILPVGDGLLVASFRP